MSGEEIRARIKAAANRFDATSFELAFDLAVVAHEKWYRQWGYANLVEYLRSDVGLSVSWGYKLASVGRVFWRYREILLQRKTDQPVTIQQLIDAVPAIERGEVTAEEALGQPIRPAASELRSVKAIPASLKPIMDRAWVLARWNLCKAEPSETELWECVLAAYCENAEQEIWASGSLRHTTSDGIQLEWTIDDVYEGRIRCQECGSWDRSSLDPHHTTPRSQQSKQTDPAGIVLLCRSCHERVQSWKAPHVA